MRHPIACTLAVGAIVAVRPAAACTCSEVTLGQQARATQVVLVVDVNGDVVRGNQHVARARIVEALRGGAVGEQVDIAWEPPNGKSCFFVELRTGRWLLFLGREGGQLTTLRCDGHSTLLTAQTSQQTLAAVRSALAASPSRDEAVALALAVANQALAAAYERDRGPAWPAHDGTWVEPSAASARRLRDGWRISWARRARDALDYQVEVEVSRSGAAHAIKASTSLPRK